MPELLVKYIANPDEIHLPVQQLKILWNEGEFAEIFAHLRRAYSLDFSKYKPNTVSRRITQKD